MTIIAILFGALLGPLFVDWSAYRQVFEDEATKVLGHPVRVLGDADARFLPIPSVTFSDVRVGESEGQSLLQVEKISIHMELMPLLRGEFEIIDVIVDRPVGSATIDDAGRLDWFLTTNSDRTIEPEKVIFKRVQINNGTLRLVDGRRDNVWTLDNVNFVGNAKSLLGPFRAEGGFSYEDTAATFAIATGKTDELGNLRVTMQVSPVDTPVSLSTDGRLSNAEGGPVYEGKYTFKINGPSQNGDASQPGESVVRSQGDFSLTSADLELPGFVVSLGPPSMASNLEGNGRILFGETPRFDIGFRTDQIDLDRSLGRGPAQPARLSQVNAILGLLALATPTELGVQGRLQLNVGSVILGGSIIERLTLDAANDEAGWRIDNFEAKFPGNTALVVSGRVEPDLASEAPQFNGRILFASLQPSRFALWARPDQPVPATPPPGLEFTGNMIYGLERLYLENVTGTLGKDAIAGEMDLRQPLGARSQLSLTVSADRLDLEAIDRLAQLFSGRDVVAAASITDNVSMNIRAKRLSSGDIEAENVILDASLSDGVLELRQIQIDNIAGARLKAEGRLENVFTRPIGTLSVTLAAEKLSGLIDLVSPYISGIPVFDAIVNASDDLAPADVSAQFSSQETDDGVVADFTMGGIVGGSPMSFKGRYAGRSDLIESGDITFNLAADSEDSSQLLRQLGLPAGQMREAIPGALSINGQGSLDAGIFTSMIADIAGTRISSEGLILSIDADTLGFDGSLLMSSASIDPLLHMAGLPSGPDLAEKYALVGEPALEMASQISVNGTRVDVEITEATFATMPMTGSGTIELGEARKSILGDFSLKKLDIPWLLSLGLGGEILGDGLEEGFWLPYEFTTSPLGGMDVAIGLKVDEVTFGGDITSYNSGFAITSNRNTLGVEILDAGIFGGILSGVINIANSEGAVVLDGRLQLEEAALEEFVWKREERVAGIGSFNMSTEFVGNGNSMIEIIASLTGGGIMQAANGEIRGINPKAFLKTLRAIDAGLELEEEKIHDVFVKLLDAGNLPFKLVEGAFSIVSGAVRANSMALDAGKVSSFGNLTLDLNEMLIDSEWDLRIDMGANNVVGAEPQVGLHFEGPIEAPGLDVDVSPFTGFLTVRAYDREVQRIENIPFDIMEKDRFAREMRAIKQRREWTKAGVDPTTPEPGTDTDALETLVREVLQPEPVE